MQTQPNTNLIIQDNLSALPNPSMSNHSQPNSNSIYQGYPASIQHLSRQPCANVSNLPKGSQLLSGRRQNRKTAVTRKNPGLPRGRKHWEKAFQDAYKYLHEKRGSRRSFVLRELKESHNHYKYFNKRWRAAKLQTLLDQNIEPKDDRVAAAIDHFGSLYRTSAIRNNINADDPEIKEKIYQPCSVENSAEKVAALSKSNQDCSGNLNSCLNQGKEIAFLKARRTLKIVEKDEVTRSITALMRSHEEKGPNSASNRKGYGEANIEKTKRIGRKRNKKGF
jgi:hypothetical protein